MADLSITLANIIKGTNAQVSRGTAGETLTAGMSVYLKASDQKIYKADADASLAAATVVGITTHGSLADQPIEYQWSGNMDFGAILTKGVTYYASDTAGGIKPAADLASDDFRTILGVASSTTTLPISLLRSGVTA